MEVSEWPAPSSFQEFIATASSSSSARFRLSKLPDIQVQQVAVALDIHPFMLSRWRKQVRDRKLRGKGVIASSLLLRSGHGA